MAADAPATPYARAPVRPAYCWYCAWADPRGSYYLPGNPVSHNGDGRRGPDRDDHPQPPHAARSGGARTGWLADPWPMRSVSQRDYHSSHPLPAERDWARARLALAGAGALPADLPGHCDHTLPA